MECTITFYFCLQRKKFKILIYKEFNLASTVGTRDAENQFREAYLDPLQNMGKLLSIYFLVSENGVLHDTVQNMKEDKCLGLIFDMPVNTLRATEFILQ